MGILDKFKRKSSSLTIEKIIAEDYNYKYEYYGAAEPLVRCGESHLSGLTEPLRSLV